MKNNKPKKSKYLFVLTLGAAIGGLVEFFFLRQRQQIESAALRSELNVVRRQAREMERRLSGTADKASSRTQTRAKPNGNGQATPARRPINTPANNNEAVVTVVPANQTSDADVSGAEVVEPPTIILAVQEDDLTQVKGIGPKIAGVLNKAGVTSLAQLAALPVSQVDQILQDAGVKLGDSADWSKQAKRLTK